MDPWQTFDDAVLAAGDERARLLAAALAALNSTEEGTAGERAELFASISCELAGLGDLPLSKAKLAVARAAALGHIGWPYYYLAESANILGDWRLVIESIHNIPEHFFGERDLEWRRVRCQELEVIALLGLDDHRRANALLDELAARYAVGADDADLAAPRELFRVLLEKLPETRDALSVMTRSLDVCTWLDSETAERVQRETNSC